MDNSLFNLIKKQFIKDLVKEIENLELPPDWSPRDVLGYVIRKIEDKGNKI